MVAIVHLVAGGPAVNIQFLLVALEACEVAVSVIPGPGELALRYLGPEDGCEGNMCGGKRPLVVALTHNAVWPGLVSTTATSCGLVAAVSGKYAICEESVPVLPSLQSARTTCSGLNEAEAAALMMTGLGGSSRVLSTRNGAGCGDAAQVRRARRAVVRIRSCSDRAIGPD